MTVILKFQNFLNNLVSSLLSLFKLLLLSRYPQSYAELRKNDECAILGNGPSLKEALISQNDFLRSKDLFCVNYFAKTEFYEQLKPRFYVLVDPAFWKDDVEAYFIEEQNVLFEILARKTVWKLILFVPFEAKRNKRWKRTIANNENIVTIFFNRTPIEGWDWFKHFCFRCNLGMPRPRNVLIPAIFIAINFKYQGINIFGADHTWLHNIRVLDDNKVVVGQEHFYNKVKREVTEQQVEEKRSRTLQEILYNLYKVFLSYEILEKYAVSRNAKIINRTKGSFIDSFAREF